MQASAQSVIATPDAGTADAGIASKPIANVAANDTVDGTPATLGATGNATIAKFGSWPSGISLNVSTGAVTTAALLPPGTFIRQYQLCDTSTPANCATTTITINIITATVVANPDYGSAITGVTSRPIANVAANDTVDGAPAVLGTTGNAVIAKAGTWPTGISLIDSSGAIVVSPTVPAGFYSVQYDLCDKNMPPDCAATTDSVVVVQALPEVQLSTVNFGDTEYDWGRDGIFCAECNFGQGNARFNWTDTSGNVWVGHIDQSTGAFIPPAGNNELVDTSGYYYATFGNGPEWAFSTQGGQVISQLVYTRHPPGTAATTANAGAAFATPVAGGWSPTFFPGALPLTDGGTMTTVTPLASQCNSDPVAYSYFYELGAAESLFWEPTTTVPGTAPTLLPFNYNASEIPGSKRAASWVPCTHQLVFIGAAPPDAEGNVYEQVFWYDTDTQVVQQLTFDANQHTEAFMFQAPEFGDTYTFYTITSYDEIDVYEQDGVGSNGAPTFQLVNAIRSPDPSEPYLTNTEPFINCTPTCQTYIFTSVQSVAPGPPGPDVANGVAVTSIDPAQPMFKILVPQGATPNIQRLDLEYYITANGPYLYYDRNTISSATSQWKSLGHYYIDMQLGVPSGSCVGSSAEAGMAPGC